METNESGLSSYYHHHQPQPQPPPPPPPQHSLTATTTATTTASPTNGILPNTPQMAYPHSVPSAAVSSPLETARRKRGRPRKYGTPEQAAAAKRLSSAASQASNSMKKEHVGGGGGGAYSSASTKKSQLAALGSAGQSFTPHIIAVAAGEDVGQKIMWFMQQSKSEICILSASGSISNVSLRQPATSGGSITYEGRFDIISLSGSYVRTELGGRSGGLSACLATTDGQIIGGGVGGPLTAAGPIQVIVGTFIVDTKKDIVADVKADTFKMTPAVSSVPVSSSGFRAIDSSGSQFTIQPPRGMQMTPLPLNDWSGADTSNTGFDFSGRMGGGAHQSPENGDYEHIADRD